MKKRLTAILAVMLSISCLTSGCAVLKTQQEQTSNTVQKENIVNGEKSTVEDNTAIKQENGQTASYGKNTGEKNNDLVYAGSMELKYAEHFSADYYEGGYTLLKISDGTKILVVPEAKEVPEGLEGDIIVLEQPVKNIYLVSTGVVDMFYAIDALDTIGFSGQKEDGWYVESAREAMRKGDIIYAGSYNTPDYELLVSGNCSLSIQGPMILYAPEAREMLEGFGIPVIIDYSYYESHPLGKVEWVKFIGVLAGKEEEANEAFSKQVAVLEEVTANEKTDKTVAFFYITSSGLVQVRNSSDYIPKMIELAGGKYIFENMGDPNRSTTNLQVEEFYNGAKDADFIIYNNGIGSGVGSIKELLDKCPVLEDFKAVKEGNVWCTTDDIYQQTMSIGYLIEDMHAILQGESEGEMRYLFRLN